MRLGQSAPTKSEVILFHLLSIDTKKKELSGAFKNSGRTWRRQALDVLATDFPQDAEGKAIAYGVYDLGCNTGYVVVGTSHETPAFAMAALRAWWLAVGLAQQRGQSALLIQADGGGANGSRCWLWKFGLQPLADEFNLTITLTHYPTGASQWNAIEHRLCCHLSSNWAGQPLISFETVLKFILTTKTETSLRCRARLDSSAYQTGLKITRAQKAQINLQPQRFLPKYNYTIRPHKDK